MKFYNKYWQSNYDELITYYPRFYREVIEMVAILKANGGVLDTFESELNRSYLNAFIREADSATITEWEKALHIVYTNKLSLDQRKSVVIGRICGYGHVSETMLREIIAQYTENNVAIDFDHILSIVIEGEIFDETNLLDTLLRRIPAHISLDMMISIRRQFRQNIDILHSGAVITTFNPQPIGEDRTATTACSVAHGSFLPSNLTATPPEVRKAATGRINGADGLYYHTHTKSKLIE